MKPKRDFYVNASTICVSLNEKNVWYLFFLHNLPLERPKNQQYQSNNEYNE